MRGDHGVILGGESPWQVHMEQEEEFRGDGQRGRRGLAQDRHYGAPFGPDLELLARRQGQLSRRPARPVSRRSPCCPRSSISPTPPASSWCASCGTWLPTRGDDLFLRYPSAG